MADKAAQLGLLEVSKIEEELYRYTCQSSDITPSRASTQTQDQLKISDNLYSELVRARNDSTVFDRTRTRLQVCDTGIDRINRYIERHSDLGNDKSKHGHARHRFTRFFSGATPDCEHVDWVGEALADDTVISHDGREPETKQETDGDRPGGSTVSATSSQASKVSREAEEASFEDGMLIWDGDSSSSSSLSSSIAHHGRQEVKNDTAEPRRKHDTRTSNSPLQGYMPLGGCGSRW